MRKTCIEGESKTQKHGNWILSETWHLTEQRSMLRRSGHLCQASGRRLTRRIFASLKQDQEVCMASVGSTIEAKLAGGNVRESFHHLKGLYRVATDTHAKPCYRTMEHQMSEWVDGNPLPILVDPIGIDNNPPEDGKIWSAVARLSNGHAAGA